MVARIVHLYIAKENKPDFLEMFEKRKEKIRNFPGCKYLNLLMVDLDDCCKVTTFSHWESESDLNRYRKSELFGQVWPLTKTWMVKKPEAETHELIEVLP